MSISSKKLHEQVWSVVHEMGKEVSDWRARLARDQAAGRRLVIEIDTLCRCLRAEEIAKAKPEQLAGMAPSLVIGTPEEKRLVVVERVIQCVKQMVEKEREEDLRSSLQALLYPFFFCQDRSLEVFFIVLRHGLDQFEKLLPALAVRFELSSPQLEVLRAWIQLKQAE